MMAPMDRHLLGLPPGPVDLAAIPTDATPGFDGDKKAAKSALSAMADELADLQERLFAEGRAGSSRSVLLVLQGMDTSGKGGTLKHTIGLFDPQGVRITSFGAPTAEELRHDFLWRVRRGLPAPGIIGVFDRSHYEDVLAARVRGLADSAELERRYDAIHAFETELVDRGTTLLKCLLHISPAEQKRRLLGRLDNPAKHWKYDPADIDDRRRWPAYRAAYELAMQRSNTAAAPWYVVPSDHKWYRNLAVGCLLRQALRELDPRWPAADFDPAVERTRLEDSPVA